MNIFNYDFMIRAFIAGIALAIIIPCIGFISVLKKSSMIGETLAHTSLSGVAAGLIMGYSPIVGAIVACIIASFAVEGIRKKVPKNGDLAIGIVLCFGVSLAGILSKYVSSGMNFNSYLFGSIALINDVELYMILGMSLFVLIVFFYLIKDLYLVSLDERLAKLSGVNVGLVNFIFTILTAITVSIAASTVGALIVSSLMIIPTSCALQFEKGFMKTLLISIVFGILYTIIGLFLAFYLDFRPGATIVLVGAITFVVIVIIKGLISYVKMKEKRE